MRYLSWVRPLGVMGCVLCLCAGAFGQTREAATLVRGAHTLSATGYELRLDGSTLAVPGYRPYDLAQAQYRDVLVPGATAATAYLVHLRWGEGEAAWQADSYSLVLITGAGAA
ncbi:MAG: hypothetical protein SFY70_05660, partial [Bacteroidia bacterium]|nr:hypothetical protein [Bacteroidia bacterium]